MAASRRTVGLGMEVPGRELGTYEVIAWGTDGTQRPFMRFKGAFPA